VFLLILWTLFVWIFARKNYQAALGVLEARKKSYQQQIDALKDAHNKEILQRDNLIEEYQDTVAKLEVEFAKREEELNESHKKIVRDIVVKSKKDPSKIDDHIEKVFGFRRV